MCYDAFEEALLDFHHENKAKHYQIFAVEIWASIPNALGKHHLGPHPFRNQTSKPRKLMPIAHFQLPMSLNYDFTKIKDYLRMGVGGE